MKSTTTLTFGDCGENHKGMQVIGKLSANGFSYTDLVNAKILFEAKGCKCELICLNDDLDSEHDKLAAKAYVLIIRSGVNAILGNSDGADLLLSEQNKLDKDKKAFMYGRVVNKVARYNLCFDTTAQEPNYKEGKGRIISFQSVPILSELKSNMSNFINNSDNLIVEANYYYDITKCGIGFHGDTERRKVLGVRLGATIPLHYQWFYLGVPIGKRIKLSLNHGDFYMMSEKAVGFDWKKKNIPTLRHAAGCEKYLKI